LLSTLRPASKQHMRSYVTGIELTLTDGNWQMWGHKQ
jgi:hypothetical protein